MKFLEFFLFLLGVILLSEIVVLQFALPSNGKPTVYGGTTQSEISPAPMNEQSCLKSISIVETELEFEVTTGNLCTNPDIYLDKSILTLLDRECEQEMINRVLSQSNETISTYGTLLGGKTLNISMNLDFRMSAKSRNSLNELIYNLQNYNDHLTMCLNENKTEHVMPANKFAYREGRIIKFSEKFNIDAFVAGCEDVPQRKQILCNVNDVVIDMTFLMRCCKVKKHVSHTNRRRKKREIRNVLDMNVIGLQTNVNTAYKEQEEESIIKLQRS